MANISYAGFVEMLGAHEFTVAVDGTTGRKKFTKGTGTLPRLGDPFDDDNLNCVARSMTKTYLGDKRLTANIIWTIEYSTATNQEAGLDEDLDKSELLRTMEIGGEWLNCGEQAGVKWTTAATAVPRDLTKKITIATTNIVKVFRDYNRLLTLMKTYCGKTNSAAFMGQEAGTILLGGATATEYINAEGHKRWKATFSFQLRCITDNLVVPGTVGGWNHIWDKGDPKNLLHKIGWDTTTLDIYEPAEIWKVLEG